MKKIKQGKEARLKLKEGIDLVADIVKETLCPKGKNVIVQQLNTYPRSLNDGHYIAQNIQHDNPTINAGVELLKAICKKTNDEAGDGTTTTAILAQKLVELGLKDIEAGKNSVDVKNLLKGDLIHLLNKLKGYSKEVKTIEDIKNIATIAGNNDEEIGEAVKEIFNKVGWHASIITEKTSRNKIETKTVKGIYFKQGYRDLQGFVNNSRKMTVDLEEVKVLCVDDTLKTLDDLTPFLTKVMEGIAGEGKVSWDLKLLIIANDIHNNERVLQFLADHNNWALNRATQDKGKKTVGFHCAVVQAPFVGDEQSQILKDIAIATGGVCVNKELGFALKDIDNPDQILGNAKRIIVEKDNTTILGGKASKDKLAKRIEMIKGEIDQTKGINKKTKLQDRLDILMSGVGIIKAGGYTEIERQEKILRIEDAVLAVKSGIEEGICVGGGQTYWRLSKDAKTKYLKEACLAIPKQIAKNAGKKVIDKTSDNIGYNALTDKFEDLEQAGITDSTKVIRVALEGAISFASMFLTTNSSIIEYEDKANRQQNNSQAY